MALEHYYSQPCALTSVSPIISKLIKTRYNRETYIIPDGIDTELYHPGNRPNNNTILLVGNPYLRFKGFNVALRALEMAWQKGYRFNVNWVCQQKTEVNSIHFNINYIVEPPQEELARYYRESDMLLFTSWYEGFGMPPLEAMASGTPVITTNCGGVESYVKDGKNALIVDPGDYDSIALLIMYLIDNKEARDTLSKNGRETALEFDFSKVVIQLEDYLRKLAATKDMKNK
jgi:glycosyltransferase involved in cell wall biosynthesis